MQVSGKIIGANFDYSTGKHVLSLQINETNNLKMLVDELNGKEKLSIEVKPYREKRSLDANAYFWVLANKLSGKIGVPSIQIYRDLIQGIGGNNEVVCVKSEAVEKLCEGWRKNGIGWVTETFPSKIEGCTNVILYYGSSTYDKKQMGILVDRMIEICQENGIETITPREQAIMVARWGAK